MSLLAASVLGSRSASQADAGLWWALRSGQATEPQEFLGRPHADPPQVLVTHQVNIIR
ncbi:MAG: hypothetical protein KDI73_11920 [Candidatus Competibacteraceae bacterium]|nr:hypothetical protein [Candidatus Competibacteraceae bacterium]